MLDNNIIKEILSCTNEETGGENALNGFEFQVSAAIYLMFLELRDKKDFELIYEKIEDFILITDEINLFQAKSLTKSLSPRLLTERKKLSNNTVGKSILEKMHLNYSEVKKITNDTKVKSNLVICENQLFSTKLNPNDSSIKTKKEIYFDEFDNNVKASIIKETSNSKYVWKDLKAIRLIPKSNHEAVTRAFIEDVTTELYGENKINSQALYNALSNEIRRIRKAKITLSKTKINSEINKYANFDNDIKFKDLCFLLKKEDQMDLLLINSFRVNQSLMKIKNDSIHEDLNLIEKQRVKFDYSNVYELFDDINKLSHFEYLRLRRSTSEIKALTLYSFGKEILQ